MPRRTHSSVLGRPPASRRTSTTAKSSSSFSPVRTLYCSRRRRPSRDANVMPRSTASRGVCADAVGVSSNQHGTATCSSAIGVRLWSVAVAQGAEYAAPPRARAQPVGNHSAHRFGDAYGFPPSAAAIRGQLTKILRSDTFAAAPALSRFLQHIVEHALDGAADSLKEYAVGVEVFGRGESFDPRTDTIVRVQARRLRARN